jgi:predicted nucleic acid-binding protein
LPEVICNTSPLQYLHQLGLLNLLPKLVGTITVPPAVVEELEAGRTLGVDLPDITSFKWITVRSPRGLEPQISTPNLGRGETEVLLLAMEASKDSVVLILDDARAREAAESEGLKLTGTLGVLLDAKRAGLLQAVKPHLAHLDSLGFHLARHTREAVLKLAGELL